MIRSRIAQLRQRKEKKEGRFLSLRTIAAETGLALSTVHRLMNGKLDRVYLSTLDTLCRYFQVGDISEIVEYVPDVVEPDA